MSSTMSVGLSITEAREFNKRFTAKPLPDGFNSRVPLDPSDIAEVTPAYTYIRELERGTPHDKDMMKLRILGYLMREAPSKTAIKQVAKEVMSCTGDGPCIKLGGHYLDYFIRVFKKAKGPIPVSTSHCSRPSFDTLQKEIKDILSKVGDTPLQSKDAKKLSLVRDGFRCIASGIVDGPKYERYTGSKLSDPTRVSAIAECAHIIASSTNAKIAANDDKLSYSAAAYAIMERFGFKPESQDLVGHGIHSLSNVITLSSGIHDLFDELSLWFEAVDGKENTYVLDSNYYGNLVACIQGEITLTSTDPNLPLPNPNYLKLHATCCRVANLSGAAEYIDKMFDDLDDADVLCQDGSSADILVFALQQIMVG